MEGMHLFTGYFGWHKFMINYAGEALADFLGSMTNLYHPKYLLVLSACRRVKSDLYRVDVLYTLVITKIGS